MVFRRPFIDETGLVYNEEEGTVIFKQGDEKIMFKMPHTMKMLCLMRRSLEVLRKFHWMILGGQFNQLSHVSSPLLSKPGEY
ncbi:hypothetical protein Tco_0628331 [Tanacetum coccineum]|uniref:Uncharacterized protein n=1 Tax=Tanacetum coccineum TaxID=301880 RepID=A0ABQ4WQ05_9ASTR